MNVLLHLRDAILSLQMPILCQRSVSQISHSLPDLPMMIPTIQHSPLTRNSLGNWYRITCSTLRFPNEWFSVPNVFLNSPILSGTMSWQERRSIMTSSSQTCTPPSWITELSRTLETLNCILVPQSQPKLSRPTETGLWHGELFSKPSASFFLTGRLSLRNTMTTLHRTLH